MATVERHEVSVEIGPEEIADALLDCPNWKYTWVLSAVAQGDDVVALSQTEARVLFAQFDEWARA